MNVQEQVARLEALLSRVQHNGTALRQQRGLGLAAQGTSTNPSSVPEVSAAPVSVAVESAPARSLSSIPADAPTLIPASREPLETDFRAAAFAASGAEFEREESLEQTKPLWVGLSEPAPRFESEPVTLPPGSFTPAVTSSGPSLPPLPEETEEPAPHPQAYPLQPDEAELRDSSPPLSGERPSTRSPSLPAQDSTLEEPLAGASDTHPPIASSGFDSEPPAVSLATAPESPFSDDHTGRISDAPASALGATINLPDEDVGPVELELEQPPSSLRRATPAPDGADELEADLPRTSFRAGYDDSLSVPPAARDELIAHDLSVRERVSSAPAPAPLISEAPISEATHPGQAPSESDLPPVLSSRPHSPVTIPPQSAVEPLRSAAERAASFDADETAARPSFEAPFPEAAPGSVPPYQAAVSDVVVSARPAPPAVEFAPQPRAVAATFEGAVIRTKDASFLELLDTSLSLSVRG